MGGQWDRPVGPAQGVLWECRAGQNRQARPEEALLQEPWLRSDEPGALLTGHFGHRAVSQLKQTTITGGSFHMRARCHQKRVR